MENEENMKEEQIKKKKKHVGKNTKGKWELIKEKENL